MQTKHEPIDQLFGVCNKNKNDTNDLSIASTKTKYLKLNTKTQFFLITFNLCTHFIRDFFPLLFSCQPCQSV